MNEYYVCTRCNYREATLLTPDQKRCDHKWKKAFEPRTRKTRANGGPISGGAGGNALWVSLSR